VDVARIVPPPPDDAGGVVGVGGGGGRAGVVGVGGGGGGGAAVTPIWLESAAGQVQGAVGRPDGDGLTAAVDGLPELEDL
jgi:hypothetical protein